MAADAESPFGMTWAYAALLAVALLVTLVCILWLVGGRRIRSTRIGLLMAALVGAAAWTFFTVSAPVTVPIAEDPQGAECLVDPFGENPERRVDWDGDCGRAFARHLVVSTGPTAAGIAICVALGGWLIHQRRSRVSAVA